MGGTKSIFIPSILQPGIDEYVYASPIEGGFQIALAKNMKDKATIFIAKRNTPHRNLTTIKEEGATVKQVPIEIALNQAKGKALFWNVA